MRRILCLLLLSLPLAADEAILVATLTTNATSAPTGGTVAFTARVENRGNASTLGGIRVTLNSSPGAGLVTSEPSCRLERYGATCFMSALRPGESFAIPFTAGVTNEQSDVGGLFTASMSLLAFVGDDAPAQTGDAKQFPITMSPALADLGVRFVDPPGPQPIGAAPRTIEVTNHGPSAATPLVVDVIVESEPLRLTGTDAPWSCTTNDANLTARRFVCTLASLPAGATSNLTLHFETTLARDYLLIAIPWTANATDPNEGNDVATGGISPGVASDFAPFLLPLLVNRTPGAHALWTSEVWAFSTPFGASLFVCYPPDCPASRDNAIRLSTNDVIKVWPAGVQDAPHGALLYTERTFAPRLSFSSRLTSSAAPPSRGVELPVVRESDYRSRVIIPGIVVDASHRFLVRVYDPDARPNATVTVRVFRRDPSLVRAERILPLITRPQRILNILPAYPGYAETSDIFDGLIPEEDSRELGIEVFSSDPTLRLWAFVSATENQGEHVTVWTPQ